MSFYPFSHDSQDALSSPPPVLEQPTVFSNTRHGKTGVICLNSTHKPSLRAQKEHEREGKGSLASILLCVQTEVRPDLLRRSTEISAETTGLAVLSALWPARLPPAEGTAEAIAGRWMDTHGTQDAPAEYTRVKRARAKCCHLPYANSKGMI